MKKLQTRSVNSRLKARVQRASQRNVVQSRMTLVDRGCKGKTIAKT